MIKKSTDAINILNDVVNLYGNCDLTVSLPDGTVNTIKHITHNKENDTITLVLHDL